MAAAAVPAEQRLAACTEVGLVVFAKAAFIVIGADSLHLAVVEQGRRKDDRPLASAVVTAVGSPLAPCLEDSVVVDAELNERGRQLLLLRRIEQYVQRRIADERRDLATVASVRARAVVPVLFRAAVLDGPGAQVICARPVGLHQELRAAGRRLGRRDLR